LYRLKIEEQKRLREEILKQKELRRQQQAGARKRELLERLAQQQQQQQQPSMQQSYMQQDDDSSEYPTNGNPYIPHSGLQTRQNVKNRLLVKKQDVVVPNIQPKHTDYSQVGANTQYQGQQMKPVKQLRQTRTVSPSQPQASQKVLQTKPAAAPLPTTQTARVASVQARPQEMKPGVKRTVMQRTNSGSGDVPHVGSKVRVIKLSGGVSFQGSSCVCVLSWFVSVCFILCKSKIKNRPRMKGEVADLSDFIIRILDFQNCKLLAVTQECMFAIMLYCQTVITDGIFSKILLHSFKFFVT